MPHPAIAWVLEWDVAVEEGVLKQPNVSAGVPKEESLRCRSSGSQVQLLGVDRSVGVGSGSMSVPKCARHNLERLLSHNESEVALNSACRYFH